MTTKLEQAARQALEALEKTGIEGTWLLHDEAITALREALTEQDVVLDLEPEVLAKLESDLAKLREKERQKLLNDNTENS